MAFFSYKITSLMRDKCDKEKQALVKRGAIIFYEICKETFVLSCKNHDLLYISLGRRFLSSCLSVARCANVVGKTHFKAAILGE